MISISSIDLERELGYLVRLSQDAANICMIKEGEDIGTNESGVTRNDLGISIVTPAAVRFAPKSYPSFWMRDFVLSIPAGIFQPDYLRRSALLFAATQRNEDWVWYNGTVPAYTPAEHINMDGGAVFYPGSYYPDERQGGIWGPYPVMDICFTFTHLVYYAFSAFGNGLLNEAVKDMPLIERVIRAFHAVESDEAKGLCKTTAATRAVDFGFCDQVYKLGYVLFASVMKYRSALMLTGMLDSLGRQGDADEYRRIAAAIGDNLVPVFGADAGFLYAATEVCRQRDVWGTAYAVYEGALQGTAAIDACLALRDAYSGGLSVYEGSVRHILTTDDWSESSAWEYALPPRHDYQNGGYWLTASGWYLYAVSKVDKDAAKKMFAEMMAHIRRTDYRKSGEHKGPYEYVDPVGGRQGCPVNLTSIACPCAAVRRISDERLWD